MFHADVMPRKSYSVARKSGNDAFEGNAMRHHDDERRAGSVIVGGFEGTTLPLETADRLRRGHLAGVTLFKWNLTDPMQAAALCAELTDAAPLELSPLLAIDQEGGRVRRLNAPMPVLPPMRVLGAIDDTALTERAGRMLGVTLAAVGFNLDFAPVADVDSNPRNPIIGDRSFGGDPALVARHVAALTRGVQSTGVLACAKHFPGHGDTEHDSHLELPRVRADRAHLDAIELPPFRAAIAAGVASVMTAHVVYDGFVGDAPATMSRRVVHDLLRAELGFEGVCFSDDLHMRAIAERQGVEAAAIAAIEAGCDALLICRHPESQERARIALARRAADDPVFAARLYEASDRVCAMRQRARLRPLRDPDAVRAVLEDPAHRALLDEIARRAPTP